MLRHLVPRRHFARVVGRNRSINHSANRTSRLVLAATSQSQRGFEPTGIDVVDTVSTKRPVRAACFRFYSSAPAPSEDFGAQYRLLTEKESILLEEQRALTERARAIASQVLHEDVMKTDSSPLLPEDESAFLIVVAGEFNAGKSTVINALLGTKLLETGALPTTDSIIILTSPKNDEQDDAATRTITNHAGVVLHSVPNVPLLQDLTLIDTPGTNAVVQNHTARTMKLLPSADLILFVTSADRPFSESERSILKSIQAYRKHIVVLINKMDVLETAGGNYGQEEKQRVVEFVADNASELLGARPIVIPISARDAISTKLAIKDTDSNLWKRSNFAALESFLKETLTTETKIKAKLASPIGIVDATMAQCLGVLQEEKKELGVDIATLNLLKSQFKSWETEISAELASFRRSCGDVLASQGARCEKILRRMSLLDWYMFALLDDSKFSSEWKRSKRIGADSVEEELLNLVGEMADSVATSARAQGQAVIEYLGKRPAVKSQSLVGSVTAASKFDDTKNALLGQMSDSIRSVLSDYEEVMEKDELVQSFKQAVLLSSVLQAGAVGAALATTTSTVGVVPGLATTTALVTSGVAVLSQGTKRVSTQYQETWKDRETELDESLEQVSSQHFEKKMKAKILQGVSPYTRYVEAEKERISTMIEECETVQLLGNALRNRISKLHR